jgi:hypothetical protein
MIAKVKVEQQLIKVYDSDDRVISSLDSTNKELVGISNDFYIVYHKELIEVYDADSTIVSSMPKNGMVVKGTLGETFTVHNDVFIESYDINCNRLHINNAPSAALKLRKRELSSTKSILLIEQIRLAELTPIFVSLQQYEAAVILKPIKIKIDEAINLLENLV